MNRRSFILSGTAVFALLGTGAAAQRGSASSSVIVSQVTGAEIDFTESGFTLEHQEINLFMGADGIAYDNEHIHFVSDHGKLEIELLATGLYDWQRDMAEFIDGFKRDYTVEEHVYADVANGGYSVFSFDTTAAYIEYQIGSFPDVDMRAILWTEQDAFQNDLALAQTILVGGAAPFMYMAESGAADIVFASAAQTTTTGSRSTRSTRATTGIQSTSTTPTNSSETTPTTSTGTGSSSSTSSTGADPNETEYLDIIVNHREQFLTSYDLFMSHLGIVGDETTTDTEKSDLFQQMYEIALDWKTYPDVAMAPTVPSSLTEISATYVIWSLTIGEMGSLFEQLYNGVDTTDAFIAAVGDWEAADAQLQAALAQYGFQGFSRAINSIRVALNAAWHSLQ